MSDQEAALGKVGPGTHPQASSQLQGGADTGGCGHRRAAGMGGHGHGEGSGARSRALGKADRESEENALHP